MPSTQLPAEKREDGHDRHQSSTAVPLDLETHEAFVVTLWCGLKNTTVPAKPATFGSECEGTCTFSRSIIFPSPVFRVTLLFGMATSRPRDRDSSQITAVRPEASFICCWCRFLPNMSNVQRREVGTPSPPLSPIHRSLHLFPSVLEE